MRASQVAQVLLGAALALVASAVPSSAHAPRELTGAVVRVGPFLPSECELELPPEPAKTLIGKMHHTFYYMERETDFGGVDDAVLLSPDCTPVAEVPGEFAERVCLQGSGRLAEGGTVTASGGCDCPSACPSGSGVCFGRIDSRRYPWGQVALGGPARPLRSWAVDPQKITLGTVVYAKEWDGMKIPRIDGLGGFTHDGCFRAEDVGGGIRGDHYDMFVGSKRMRLALERMRGTGAVSEVYRAPEHCNYLVK